MQPQDQQPPQSQPATTVSSTPPIQPAQEFQSQPQFVAPQQKRRIPLLVKILGGFVVGIILLIVIIFVIVGAATKEPQKISDAFIDNVQSGNLETAYEYTSSSFKDSLSSDEFKSALQSLESTFSGEESITDRKISKQSGSPSIAVFVYKVNHSDGSTHYIKTEIQENSGKWELLNFRSSASNLDTTVE